MSESSKPALKPRTVICPACGGTSLYATSNPYRPFCSDRCKHMDLGAWASESFRVPASPPQDPAAPEDQWTH